MKCDIFSPTLVTAKGQAVAVHQWPRRDFLHIHIANPSEQERNLQQVRLLQGQESDLQQIYRRPQVSHMFPSSAHNKGDDQVKSYCPNNKTSTTNTPPPKRFWQPLHSNQNNGHKGHHLNIWMTTSTSPDFWSFLLQRFQVIQPGVSQEILPRLVSTSIHPFDPVVGSRWIGLVRSSEMSRMTSFRKTSSHLPEIEIDTSSIDIMICPQNLKECSICSRRTLNTWTLSSIDN